MSIVALAFTMASCTKTIVFSDTEGHTRAIKVSGQISSTKIEDKKLLQFRSEKGTTYNIPEGVYSYEIK